jgi:hypothetical protein
MAVCQAMEGFARPCGPWVLEGEVWASAEAPHVLNPSL